MGWYSRALSKVGPSRWFALLAAPLAAPLDRAVHRLTGGRRMLMPSDLPSLMLTTTGRRSGQPRHVPLLFVEDDSGYAVAGTNWGRTPTPDWVLNLEANPQAVVEAGDGPVPVVAQPVPQEEQDRLWAAFEELWPGYRSYRKRATHRAIRVFLLLRI